MRNSYTHSTKMAIVESKKQLVCFSQLKVGTWFENCERKICVKVNSEDGYCFNTKEVKQYSDAMVNPFEKVCINYEV